LGHQKRVARERAAATQPLADERLERVVVEREAALPAKDVVALVCAEHHRHPLALRAGAERLLDRDTRQLHGQCLWTSRVDTRRPFTTLATIATTGRTGVSARVRRRPRTT